MRVIMTGGGTGGHIYPAIAIADKIRDRGDDHTEILFVGTEHGLERELVPARGYPIRFITVRGLDRRRPLRNIKVMLDYNKGHRQAKKILEEFRPDCVIGTGGYVCGPVVRAAAAMGIRCYIQEQNAYPGLTNRLLERSVENVFLGFEEAGRYFKHPEKHIVTGNPVRAEFFTASPTASRQRLGVEPDQFMLLAFGGSQGAGRVNRAMIDTIIRYNGVSRVQIFFATGSSYYQPVRRELQDHGVELADNIHIVEYIEDMATYLSACDLVVSRSGALTVSEITICGKPSILIPSPNVTGDHQTFNARALSDKGAAILMKEEQLEDNRLYLEIERLRQDPAYLEGMAGQCRRAAMPDSADIIYYTLIT
ncbi:MAG: undecaprenyldiphospho-muramoylpentapeptide beta-N-acetylglucosaminyltransferase [Anaerovoracaceae bacterium]|jgi:UDP-N-acetylglucosamine--N-acetylmuramyl-(pentapeptide) pyrophosphoryl-undecaprenol N-acetylglucosamine transferase